MRYPDLPIGAKKAIIHYSILESGNDDLGDFVFQFDELNDDAWCAILAHSDNIWQDRTYSLSLLTPEQAGAFVERFSPDVMDDWGGYENFRKESGQCSDIPEHSTNDWPVLAMPSCGEALLDGWHRFHSYLNQGFDVYVVNLDSIAEEANKAFEIQTMPL